MRFAVAMGCCGGNPGGTGGALNSLPSLKKWGISEVHWVSPFSGNPNAWNSQLIAIRNAGMDPILNPFNDSAGQPGTLGDLTGWAAALKNLGWHGVAGEGVAGNYVAQIQKSLPYVNYAGYLWNGPQVDVYSDPYYAHPASGTAYGHADYIETYNNTTINPGNSTVSVATAAGRTHNSKNVGILIGAWFMESVGTWENIIGAIQRNGVAVKTVLIWRGYDGYDPWTSVMFQNGVANGLKSAYGLTVSTLAQSMGASTTPASTTKPATTAKAAAKPAAKPAPKPVTYTETISIAWVNQNPTNMTDRIGWTFTLKGHASYKSSVGVTSNAPVNEKLDLYQADPATYALATAPAKADLTKWGKQGTLGVANGGDFTLTQASSTAKTLYLMVVNQATPTVRSNIVSETWYSIPGYTPDTETTSTTGTGFNPNPVDPIPSPAPPGICVILRDTHKGI